MMQQKEARRKHPCVLPEKVVFLVWVSDSALIWWWVLPACFLRASCVLPACFLRASWMLTAANMLQYTKITTSKLNWMETHTILPTFLRSTQEAHMGASFCCIINGSQCISFWYTIRFLASIWALFIARRQFFLENCFEFQRAWILIVFLNSRKESSNFD